jgi:hypothetical protein
MRRETVNKLCHTESVSYGRFVTFGGKTYNLSSSIHICTSHLEEF